MLTTKVLFCVVSPHLKRKNHYRMFFIFRYSGGGGGSYGSYGSRGGGSRGGSRGGGYDRDRGSRFGDRGGYGGRDRGGKPEQGSTLRPPRWDLARLSKIEKNFYTPNPITQQRTDVNKSLEVYYIGFRTLYVSILSKSIFIYIHSLQHEVQQYYAANEITMTGKNLQKPMLTFQEALFPGTA